jgi:hypothetical protein
MGRCTRWSTGAVREGGWVAVAVRGVAVVTWQCVYRPGWVIAVILSGDKFKIG